MTATTQHSISDKQVCLGLLPNVQDALYALSGKWKLAIILNLVQSPKRFNEILHEVKGISPKVLASELKHLELNEFIERKVYASDQVSIIYEATEHSRSLKKILYELSIWGVQHKEKIKQSIRDKAFSRS